MLRSSLKISWNLFTGKSSSVKKKAKLKTKTAFSDYARNFILLSSKRVSQSTLRNYSTALTSFSTFLDGKDIAADEITKKVISDYAYWLHSKNVSDNTSSCYMRSLRAIYNSAVRHKFTSQKNPFSSVFTGNRKTVKRAMDEKSVGKILTVALEKDSPLILAKDIFAFCVYSMGMPFVDVYCLKKNQISADAITYKRHKTGQLVTIPVDEAMRDIINRYADNNRDFVFPLGQNDKNFNYTAYSSALCQYNRLLKKIALKADVTENISSYSARHTWASIAFMHDVPLSVISQALGHTSVNTTLIYIRGIEMSKLASINKKIINELRRIPIDKRQENERKTLKINELGKNRFRFYKVSAIE